MSGLAWHGQVINTGEPTAVHGELPKGMAAHGDVAWLAQLPVTPGSIAFTTAGSHPFTVPQYNQISIDLSGAGGGGGAGSALPDAEADADATALGGAAGGQLAAATGAFFGLPPLAAMMPAPAPPPTSSPATAAMMIGSGERGFMAWMSASVSMPGF